MKCMNGLGGVRLEKGFIGRQIHLSWGESAHQAGVASYSLNRGHYYFVLRDMLAG